MAQKGARISSQIGSKGADIGLGDKSTKSVIIYSSIT
jgi:hypothetical protein